MPDIGVLPSSLIAFVATALLGFLIGLELHNYRREAGPDLGFGTTRTLTLIAVLGFGLWLLDSSGRLYGIGFIALTVLLAIYYWHRAHAGKLGLLPTLVALLSYGLGPIAQTQPVWLLFLLVVIIVVMLGEQPIIRRLSDAFPGDEAVTLAKFLIMSGVILPLLPSERLGAPFGGLTYREIWLAVVVVSAISYVSYIARRYLFPRRGLLIGAALGGLYSSTAVTVVLARLMREQAADARSIQSATILATAMMYLRLWLLAAFLGSLDLASRLLLPFGSAFFASLVAVYAIERGMKIDSNVQAPPQIRNPLELPIAFLFALLLVVFVAASQFALDRFGQSGIGTLALASGFGDVDAFVLALLTGKLAMDSDALCKAIVIVSGSNNLLKAIVFLVLAKSRRSVICVLWLAALAALSVMFGFLGPHL